MAGEKNSKYKPEYDEQAYNYALLGALDKKMAEFFGVSESTFYLWKNEHPSFSEALSRGKSQADAMVAKSLYHRAIGYSHPETKIATRDGQITDTLDVKKHYAPDTAAASLWLRNRQPDLWRDKKEMVVEENNLTPWSDLEAGVDE
ncbi:terminase small subunit, partial [Vibrio phage K367 g1]